VYLIGRILLISLVVFLFIFTSIVFRSYRLVRITFISNMFKEIYLVGKFVVSLMVLLIGIMILNYISFIYFRVGIRMNYGYVFLYTVFLLLVIWFIWLSLEWRSMVSHFLPTGVTGLLRLFIPLIEILGVMIRPITLAVRLATNIRCGHVVLLIFGYFSVSYRVGLVLIVSLLIFALFIIELLVCLIQAYVFWRLVYIYVMDIEYLGS